MDEESFGRAGKLIIKTVELELDESQSWGVSTAYSLCLRARVKTWVPLDHRFAAHDSRLKISLLLRGEGPIAPPVRSRRSASRSASRRLADSHKSAG